MLTINSIMNIGNYSIKSTMVGIKFQSAIGTQNNRFKGQNKKFKPIRINLGVNTLKGKKFHTILTFGDISIFKLIKYNYY